MSKRKAGDGYGPLGRVVACPESYDASLLVPIPRSRGRTSLGVRDESPLPFSGNDSWTLYEASWLQSTGKPRRLVLQLDISASSPHLVESKSLKLYMNSLNFKRFASDEDAMSTIKADVGRAVGGECYTQLCMRELCRDADEPPLPIQTWWDGTANVFSTENYDPDGHPWELIDGEDIGELSDCAFGEPDEGLLHTDPRTTLIFKTNVVVEEQLVTHLLRTLCPCTSQPDWGSLFIQYEGEPIDRPALLRYICMMRREVGFHENAVEKVFLAIQSRCRPQKLRVTGRFMRRGGIDINPTRFSGYTARKLAGPQLRVPGQ